MSFNDNIDKIRDIDIEISKYSYISKMSAKETSKYYMKLYFKFIKLLELYEDGNFDISNEEYLNLAKDLIIFSKYDTSAKFKGIDEERNMIYIAVIYYILGYEFECNLILDLLDIYDVENEYLKIIIHLLRNSYYECRVLNHVKNYYINEGSNLDIIIKELYRVDGVCETKNQTYIQIIISILKNIKTNGFYSIIEKKSKLDINIWRKFVQRNIKCNQIMYNLPKYHCDLIKNELLNMYNGYINMPNNYSKVEMVKIVIFNYLNLNSDKNVIIIYNNKDEYNINAIKKFFTEHSKNINFVELDLIENINNIVETNDFIIIYDFSDVSTKKYGIQYEILISLTLKLEKQILILNNSEFKIDFEQLKDVTYNKDISRYDNIVNYYFKDGKNKELEIEYGNQKFVTDSYILNKNINQEINLRGFKLQSSGDKSLLSAINLISKGYKVSIFIPQKNSAKSGILKICNKLLDLIDRLDSNILYDKNCIDDLKLLNRAESLLGKESIYMKLLKFGVIVLYSDMPQEIIEYMRYFIQNGKYKIIIGDKILTKNLSKYTDVLIINSIRINIDKSWVTIDNRLLSDLIGDFSDEINKKHIIISNYEQKKIYKEKIRTIKKGLILNSFISQSLYNIELFKLNYEKEVNNILNSIEYTICENIIFNYNDNFLDNLLYTNNQINIDNRRLFIELLNKKIEKLKSIDKKRLITIYKSKTNLSYLDIYDNLSVNYTGFSDEELIKYIFYNYIVLDYMYNEIISNVEYFYEVSLSKDDIYIIIELWINEYSYNDISALSKIDNLEIIFWVIEKVVKGIYVETLCKLENICKINESINLNKRLNYIKNMLQCGLKRNIFLEKINYTFIDRELMKKINLFMEKNKDLYNSNINTILINLKEFLNLDEFEEFIIDKLIQKQRTIEK
ncbi:hypothetical protein [Paraclostridium sordellii]|uniref:hypothetical protein n=1 Tax=Paraclostridium sordellii TaxID=1505 RepID=UPI0030D07B52